MNETKLANNDHVRFSGGSNISEQRACNINERPSNTSEKPNETVCKIIVSQKLILFLDSSFSEF